MFKWKKLGRIFNPLEVKNRSWLKEFAQAPAVLIFDNFIRVYFSCRPPRDNYGQYVSYSAFVDLNRYNLFEIVNLAKKPILELGELGTFDEFGTYPVSVIRHGEEIIAYLLKERGIDNIGKCIDLLSKKIEYQNKDRFLEDIGENKITRIRLKEYVKENCKKEKQVRFWNIKLPFSGSDKKTDPNETQLSDYYQLADCCSPLPGKDIIGIHDFSKNKIIIHEAKCPTAIADLAFGEKAINVKWTSQTKISVLKEFIIQGRDEPGILNKIISTISKNLSVNIKSINFDTEKSNFKAKIKLYTMQEDFSENLIKQLKKIPAVNNIEIIN